MVVLALAPWERLVVGLAIGLVGCGGSAQMVCQRDPATGIEQCQPTTGSPGNAALTTGVAAGVYGFTGCTVNGCQLPDRCNPKTKRCEPLRCSETDPCPAGYQCQLDTKLCR